MPNYTMCSQQVLAAVPNRAWDVISPHLAQHIQDILKPITAGVVDLGWIRELIRGFQADNWDDLTLEEISDVATLTEITSQGIAVAWVPRAGGLSKLMAA